MTFKATNFLSSEGVAVTPTSVVVYLDYPSSASKARTDATVTLSEADDVWTGEWDSSVAYPGTVYCSMQAEGSDDFAIDSEFQVTANQANPEP